MLHLRRCNLPRLLSSPAASPIPFPVHRLISAAAPSISPNPSFAVEDYLVGTCGLTRAQALKASIKLSRLKSPSRPDAVLTFLADLGLSGADVATAVAKDPQLLCTSVEKMLAPNVVGLTGIGLSHTEIARLVSLVPFSFRYRSIVSNLPYYLPLFGSFENLLHVLKCNSNLLGTSVDKFVKPNVAFLRKCGISAWDITKLCKTATWLLTINPERLPVIVACAEGLGVPRGSLMFRHALHAVTFLTEEKIVAQLEYLKNLFRWSHAHVRIAISKHPLILGRSKESLQSRSEFLLSEVGLEPAYIAHLPALICYSLEGRLKPRFYVMKFLKENGLLDRERSYYSAVAVTEKVFVEKYISPYNEAAPYLTEDYATTCRGEVPPRFIFASTKGGL
uniref:Uncharacterized protein n=3 Tax=Avena sativa TaxID=4498 RepID=A0ACD5TAZ2_AVESA